MGNSTSTIAKITGSVDEASLRKNYEEIKKAHRFAEVLVSFDEARRQLWRNMQYLDKATFDDLRRQEVEASLGDDSAKVQFRSNVFQALMATSFSGGILDNDSDIIESTGDSEEVDRELVRRARAFIFIQRIKTLHDSKDTGFWIDMSSVLDGKEILRRLDAWRPDWKTLLKQVDN